jgi:hypothetical protein|tara:strand:+ start:115 stop:468 length:354 start_codon:yes stop_codon:yes gene_type:complete
MPEGVTYTKEAEADAYAKVVGGTVVPVDTDGDGTTDGYNVIEPQSPGEDEGSTSGVTTVYGRKEGSVDYEGSSTRNMGGVVKDELGYMNGGMSYNERGPIKYSKGGAVKGKTFRGSY